MDDMWALDLSTLRWAQLHTFGDAPPPLQETLVLPLKDGGVVLWGGYEEKAGCQSEQSSQLHLQSQRREKTSLPYLRDVYRYDAFTCWWRNLDHVGDGLPFCAQCWGIQVKPNTFLVGGGYGITAQAIEQGPERG